MHLSSRLLVLSSLKILFIALFLLQLRVLHSPGYPPLDTLPRIGLNISLQGFVYDCGLYRPTLCSLVVWPLAGAEANCHMVLGNTSSVRCCFFYELGISEFSLITFLWEALSTLHATVL